MKYVLDTLIPNQQLASAAQHRASLDPPKLTSAQLASTHAQTLADARRKYSFAARVLFLVIDALYGRAGSLRKFRVLEVVARVPYQSWETIEYKRITKSHRRTGLARRLMDRVREFRSQQDNETWHLLILSELVDASGEREGWARRYALPRLLAIGYWHFSWLLYVLRPAWSHRLNADFEDHAEHEYAEFVRDHGELDLSLWSSDSCGEYGDHRTVADLLRQISHDERCHKQRSELHLGESRLP